jgi:hypothetical protein
MTTLPQPGVDAQQTGATLHNSSDKIDSTESNFATSDRVLEVCFGVSTKMCCY